MSPNPANRPRRLSRVRRFLGPVTWYIADDHFLAADQRLFEMQYRRVYFSDLRALRIWPNRMLWLRVGIEFGVSALLAWFFLEFRATTTVDVIIAVTALGIGIELSLGPCASARVETAHSTYNVPWVKRWRQAPALLARIEEALRRNQSAGAEAGE